MKLTVRKMVVLGASLAVAAVFAGTQLVLNPPEGSSSITVDSQVRSSAPDSELPGELYVASDSPSAIWVRENPDDPRTAAISRSIATQPVARWIGPWFPDQAASLNDLVEAAADAAPVIATFEPQVQGCEAPLSTTKEAAQAYVDQYNQLAGVIDDSRAIVVFEPGSLIAWQDCVSAAEGELRLQALTDGVTELASGAPNSLIYLEAGPNSQTTAAEMAARLDQAGLKKARGFLVNLGQGAADADLAQYAEKVNETLMSDFGYEKPYAIDSARNGVPFGGPCAPTTARLGSLPGATDSQSPADGPEMFLWVRPPGESDGVCNTDLEANAGRFVPELAANLAK